MAQCVVAAVVLVEPQEAEVVSVLVDVEAVEDSPHAVEAAASLQEEEEVSLHVDVVVTKYWFGRTFSYGYVVIWRCFRAYRNVYSTAIDGHLSAFLSKNGSQKQFFRHLCPRRVGLTGWMVCSCTDIGEEQA